MNVDAELSTGQRIEQLEDDLARAALVIHSLVEMCVRQGVFTADELAVVMEEVDLWDGVADGKLARESPRSGDILSP